MGDNCATKSMGFLQFEQLISGLPDDLAMECLLRVPITSHPSLRLVSHLWKSTVSHSSFFSNRRLARFAENHVFLIQPLSPPPPLPVAEDKSLLEESDSDDGVKEIVSGSPLLYNLNVFNTNNEEWRCLAGVTIPTFSQCVVLPAVRKLVVLGGWDPATLEPVSRVLVLDLAVGTWREGSPMPTARSFFACAAAERDESYGLSLTNEGKLWVISGYGTESQGRFRPDAEVFDPVLNTWEIVSGVWPYPGNNPKSTAVVTVEGQRRWWYVLEGEIKEFQWEDKVWKGLNLGSIPKRVTELWSSSSSVSLIDVGNGKIFLMGNGENCGGEGMFILERKNVDNNNNNGNNNCNKGQGGVNWRWQHVHAPPRFFGFPFSASHLLI